jgi:transketolase
VWTLTGDSELAEGSIWEGLDHAGHERLANFTAIFDVNRLGQRGPTELEWNVDAYAARVRAFGCEPIVIDGHDLPAIDAALDARAAADGPTVIVAKTVKGKGVSFVENKDGWHGKALDARAGARALAEIGDVPSRTFPTLKPSRGAARRGRRPRRPSGRLPRAVATRKAYGEALAALGAQRADVVVLDGEVSNSTHAEDFKQTAADRSSRCTSPSSRWWPPRSACRWSARPVRSTFAAFLTRPYDFIRMAAISRANVRLCGSHAGVSIGEDGPSQMALEDLAMMRAVHGSTVSTRATRTRRRGSSAHGEQPGHQLPRTTREKTPILYTDRLDDFRIGGSRDRARRAADDAVAVIAAGITVHEAIRPPTS